MSVSKPSAAEPPKPRAIWHNAVKESAVSDPNGIDHALAALAPWVRSSPETLLDLRNIETGKKEGHQVVRRVSAQQLNIPLNPPVDKTSSSASRRCPAR